MRPMTARLCIHGHFYQPPRENPWDGQVPPHPQARPWRDWNRRSLAECYGPVVGRALGGRGRTRRSAPANPPLPWMSFDFGPTLLHWLDRHAPDVSAAVAAADQGVQAAFEGHAPALAQAYNHLILPLAPRRDKELQVRWGLGDFRRRFGREAEGLWLPETAVDEETLAVVAGAGVRLVLLAPHQARRVRRPGQEWQETPGGAGLDCGRPWACRLPGGLEIACFFFHASLSHAVGMEGLAGEGEALAEALARAAAEATDGMVLVATDGEVYGHHDPAGAHGLAQALALCREKGPALVVPGQILAEEGCCGEVESAPGTSWSCPHGLERWRGHCGCRAGGPASWSQAWKTPLREALAWLREQAALAWQREAVGFFQDPARALDEAVDLFPDYPRPAWEAFLGRHGKATLAERDAARAQGLLEAQRLSLYALTSCGFFFDDLSGLEPAQNLRFAGKALELLAGFDGTDRTAAFLERLGPARGNDPLAPAGADLFASLLPPRDG